MVVLVLLLIILEVMAVALLILLPKMVAESPVILLHKMAESLAIAIWLIILIQGVICHHRLGQLRVDGVHHEEKLATAVAVVEIIMVQGRVHHETLLVVAAEIMVEPVEDGV